MSETGQKLANRGATLHSWRCGTSFPSASLAAKRTAALEDKSLPDSLLPPLHGCCRALKGQNLANWILVWPLERYAGRKWTSSGILGEVWFHEVW